MQGETFGDAVRRAMAAAGSIRAVVMAVRDDHPDLMAQMESFGVEVGLQMAIYAETHGHSAGWAAKKAHDALGDVLDLAHRAMNEAMDLPGDYRG
jgi:hypothetical protein